MTEAGEKLIAAAKEMKSIAQGEQPAAVIHMNGWDYVPEGDLRTLEARCRDLVARSLQLVKMLDDAEINHGSLIGGVTLRARDNLRLELSRWK